MNGISEHSRKKKKNYIRRLQKTEFSITLSKNLKKFKIEGDLWRSSGPILLLKLGHYKMVA